MEFEKYTDRAKGFLQSAQNLALRRGHQRVTREHLLKILLEGPEGLCANLIRAAGGDPKAALTAVDGELERLPRVEGSGAGQVYMSPELARAFEQAEQLAQKAGDNFVTVERLLLALAAAAGTGAAKAIAAARVNPQSLNRAIEDVRKGRKADSASAEEGYDALKKYTRDLTEAAREGKLDPVIGRDEEIILFIDELHTLVGAGKAEGAMDASNMLKPALARGELHCVGATTLDEYRKNIEKDAALERRFQPIFVGEPSVEDTISILRG